MSEIPQNEGRSSTLRNILLALAGIYIAATVVFVVMAFNRIDDLERKQTASQEELARKIADSESQTRASVGVLAEKIGITRQDLAKRAAALQRQEKVIESRLAAQEEQTKQQLGAVSGEVSGVKTDVGKVRDDVTATRSDLEATKSRLEHAIGDLNRASELIATNHDELELLKHRGDRNYYEFTLKKGKDATRLATVGLQLKKTDPKKSKFTLYVMADDKKIEKKDRTINEPLQFYTGRDHNMYEVVVNSVDKNQVTGYLATPKTIASNTGLLEHTSN